MQNYNHPFLKRDEFQNKFAINRNLNSPLNLIKGRYYSIILKRNISYGALYKISRRNLSNRKGSASKVQTRTSKFKLNRTKGSLSKQVTPLPKNLPFWKRWFHALFGDCKESSFSDASCDPFSYHLDSNCAYPSKNKANDTVTEKSYKNSKRLEDKNECLKKDVKHDIDPLTHTSTRHKSDECELTNGNKGKDYELCNDEQKLKTSANIRCLCRKPLKHEFKTDKDNDHELHTDKQKLRSVSCLCRRPKHEKSYDNRSFPCQIKDNYKIDDCDRQKQKPSADNKKTESEVYFLLTCKNLREMLGIGMKSKGQNYTNGTEQCNKGQTKEYYTCNEIDYECKAIKNKRHKLKRSKNLDIKQFKEEGDPEMFLCKRFEIEKDYENEKPNKPPINMVKNEEDECVDNTRLNSKHNILKQKYDKNEYLEPDLLTCRNIKGVKHKQWAEPDSLKSKSEETRCKEWLERSQQERERRCRERERRKVKQTQHSIPCIEQKSEKDLRKSKLKSLPCVEQPIPSKSQRTERKPTRRCIPCRPKSRTRKAFSLNGDFSKGSEYNTDCTKTDKSFNTLMFCEEKSNKPLKISSKVQETLTREMCNIVPKHDCHSKNGMHEYLMNTYGIRSDCLSDLITKSLKTLEHDPFGIFTLNNKASQKIDHITVTDVNLHKCRKPRSHDSILLQMRIKIPLSNIKMPND